MSNSLWSHGCSTPASSVLHLSPRVCSNSCPSILCPCLWYVRRLEYPNMAAESLKKNNPWKRPRAQGRSYDLVLEFTHRHFCNNLLVTQLIPSQCGRDLYKGIGGRQNSKITPKTPTSRCMCPVESSLPWVWVRFVNIMGCHSHGYVMLSGRRDFTNVVKTPNRLTLS